jgi:hypothetical protein
LITRVSDLNPVHEKKAERTQSTKTSEKCLSSALKTVLEVL